MNISKEDFMKNHCIQLEDRVVYPFFKYESFDEETESYINLIIIKTAEEMLEEENNPPQKQPSEMEVLEKKVASLEAIEAGLLLENANHQIKLQEQEVKNKEQEMTNANLLLEIAVLKGAML